MELDLTTREGNYLSSHLVSIALAYFLNLLRPSLKYAIQFVLINTLQSALRAFKKLVIVSHLNPSESLFHCRKQIEVIGSQNRQIKWVWNLEYIVFVEPL
jgi:hypothetical protein